MALRSPQARLRLAAVGITAALVWTVGASGDVLHATYRVSLVGLPIGSVNLNADLTPTSYTIAGDAKLTGLAKLFTNAHGASVGKGAIVQGHVSPAAFATIASSSNMTRTIRMALAGNTVTGIDISPPFQDKPDRVPLGPGDKHGEGRRHRAGNLQEDCGASRRPDLGGVQPRRGFDIQLHPPPIAEP